MRKGSRSCGHPERSRCRQLSHGLQRIIACWYNRLGSSMIDQPPAGSVTVPFAQSKARTMCAGVIHKQASTSWGTFRSFCGPHPAAVSRYRHASSIRSEGVSSSASAHPPEADLAASARWWSAHAATGPKPGRTIITNRRAFSFPACLPSL